MHEMSLAESVMQIIEEAAQTQQFETVRSVTLEIGELASVEPDAMRFCFDVVTRNTLAEGAMLEIVTTPGRGRCISCGEEVPMSEKYGLCPACGSPHLQIIAGEKMRVKELSVE